jgi:multidrug efflux pump
MSSCACPRVPRSPPLDAETKRRLEEWLDKDKAEFDQFEHYITYVGAGSPRYYLGLDQQLPASNVSQFVILTRER